MTTIVAVAVVVGLVMRRRRGPRVRGQHRGAGMVLAAAAHLFPPERRDWSQAMLVELDEVPGSFARWRFALGGVRAGLVAAGREPLPVAGMAVVVGVAGGIGAVAYVVSPDTHVLAIALAFVLTLVGISTPRRRVDNPVLGVTLLAGVAACVALTLFGVAEYPDAAGGGSTTVFSVALAVALGAYVWVGLGGWPVDDRRVRAAPRKTPVIVGLVFGAGYPVAGVVADHGGADVVVAVAGLAGVLGLGGFGAWLTRRGMSQRALVVVGLRTGLVAGLGYFVVAMSATYLTASWSVHAQEVLDGFEASGLADLSTYLVRDALATSITALVGLPVLVLGATWAGGAVVRSRARSAAANALGDVVR